MMKYKATLGGKWWTYTDNESIDLRQDHLGVLPATVKLIDSDTVEFETELDYQIGQKVSIGGYPTGKRNFKIMEVSITNHPVYENAKIIEKEQIDGN
ncbi:MULTISPECIES: hypothetical protein [unclassified Lactococcus]|uniref:hypothetical protein n=1 Tax=unclassified Lactococcus TaxID=2643510 RepID=UPI0011C9910F|nr:MULTISPECIES: hypothetical protein [unclassified Lactococcus]MQW22005.1 hypothetical protein [Lactococcus sp. dk101]TXK36815.1 hypothetical protein FVP42_10590 [Lactococcus sp. dk310]TXK47488.1 hypothetical protein FVP43_10255 [Lactococcus sp. dk322]